MVSLSMPDARLLGDASVLRLVAATAGDEAAPLERLDPPTRMVVVMALLGLVLLGLLLIVMVMVGARWVRRIGGRRHTRFAGITTRSAAPSFRADSPHDDIDDSHDGHAATGVNVRRSFDTIVEDDQEDTVAD